MQMTCCLQKPHCRLQYKGVGINKIYLGKLDCLPRNLRTNESYVVLDQVRTVSSERFYALLENGTPYEAELPSELLAKVRKEVVRDFLFSATKEEQNAILVDILHSNLSTID